MTTNTGSVWDRGPGDDENPLESSPADAADTADPADDEPPTLDQADAAAVDDPPPPADDVWSRGPTPSDPPVVLEVPVPVLPPAQPPVPLPRTFPDMRRPVKVLAGAMAVVLLGTLAWSLGVVGGEDADPVLADSIAQPLMPAVSIPAPAVPTTPIEAVSTESTVAPTTSTTTTTPTTTTTGSTTSTSTSTSTTTSTTTSTSTSTSSTTSTTVAPVVVDPVGPRVTIVGRVGPCKFGDDCLIADFTIADFPAPQDEFVCEFENGSRYTFRFGGRGAEQACSTSSAGGTITIEVGGVRSETITR